MNNLPPPLPAAQTSGLAITALVLGILSLTCFGFLTGIPAVVIGIVALNKIKKSAAPQKGDGLAIAGLATGAIGAFVGTAIVAALLLPAVASARERARQIACMNNERQIAGAYQTYVTAHNGACPHTFAELRQYGVSDKILRCPSDRSPSGPSYRLFCGSKPEDVIIRENQADHARGSNVAYADGRVQFVPVTRTKASP